MTSVKLGLEALQKALPALPMGSPLHSSVLKAVADIAKNMNEGGGGGDADKIQQLIAMARSAHAQPSPLAGMMPGGAPPGGGGAPPPGP